MQRFIGVLALGVFCAAAHAEQAWIAKSNVFTNTLLDIQLQHAPEGGSRQGVVKFDPLISNPTLADELQTRHEMEAALAKIRAARATEADKKVQEDLDILVKSFDLSFRTEDFELQHEVPFDNASESVFQGLRGLLDDQVAAQRRPAAVVRLRKYAGVEPGFKPYVDILKQRALEQMAKPGVIYPAKDRIETELGRNSNYIDGIASLFKKYHLSGWEPAYAKLELQLQDYDAWVKSTLLPKARTDFR
ncbi:MAG: hypothetical protein QOF42_682, partial [Gammaproteobacteria bacterium]|nr:hypothetical protein [Gammaproteobacteria bacterium]